ncbi:MAG: PKD domain-containing protein [Chitinophagales bacterium]
MKHLSVSLLIILIVCSSLQLFSQQSVQHYYGDQAGRYCKGASQLFINEIRNTVSFVRLDQNENIAPENATAWLRNDVLKLRPEDGFKQYKQEKDQSSFTHTCYRQTYKSTEVQYGVYYVHSRNNRVVNANGEWYADINLSVQPVLSPGQAYHAALNYVHADEYAHEKEMSNNKKLVVLPYEGQYKLAYACNIYAVSPLSNAWYFVDAITGSIIKSDNLICSDAALGTAITQYSGTRTITTDSLAPNSFRLHDDTRGNGVITYAGPSGTTDYYDDDNYWSTDQPAVDCHFGAEATYDYYFNHFGLNGLDGSGYNLISYAHDGLYVNAFWTGADAHFGDGDGSNYGPLTDVLIVGHEFTHGVTQFHSALIYSCESGGLNEGYSDIFGQAVDWEKNPTTASWYVSGHNSGTPFRNMANPKEFNNPNCYGGDFWGTCIDPHYESGVVNFWYYLLVTGGAGVNDLGDAYNVIGIGFDDATAIAYRTNCVYLTANATYQDARDYGVQSALDLYGDCTPQTIQCTNAWYAVGVGDPYQDAVVAGFSAPQTTFCTLPSSVAFSNSSINGTSYFWDFGDGTTDTAANPVHDYTTTGVYTVSLIVNGVSLCNTSDTFVVTNYINAQNIGSPVPAACIPIDTLPSPKYGILHFVLADIDKLSDNALEGYMDFTCSDFTQLTAGDPYFAKITVGNIGDDIRIWIDYDGNGAFDNATELVYSADDVTGTVSALIYTPLNVPLNTPLRLRIIEDRQISTITDACFNPERGQAEDYSVYFVAPPDAAPVIDFFADVTTINLGQSVNFFDLSQNSPTSWSWEFSGGVPATSSLQNPTGITYNTAGAYDVTLTATNAFGSASLIKTAYIIVNPVITLCTIDTTTLDAGTFYDSGGQTGSYGNNENCDLLIHPACAKNITLKLTFFSTDFNNDVLNVYDGPDANAPLLLSESGFPFPLPTVTGTASSMFITWTSNASGTNSGFSADWTSVVGGLITPVTDFQASDINPAYGTPVNFTDLSTNIPINWSWDFGDGTISNQQNPSHTYTTSGTYTVTLISSNCGGADTSIQIITVQEPPVMVVSPQVIDVNLNCADSYVIPVTVFNSGDGDLVYGVTETEYFFQGSQPNILALTYGADLGTKHPNTIAAMNQYFPGYTLATTATQSGDTLAMELQGKNVFLMTSPTGDPAVYSNYAEALDYFVNNGGTVIFCGATENKSDCIYNTGLLTGNFGSVVPNVAIDVVNTSHPITQGLPQLIDQNPKHTYTQAFTNGVNDLITYSGNTVTGYTDQGLGHVVYLGFDYFIPNDTASLVIGNTLSWINSNLISDFVTITPTGGGVVHPSESLEYNFTITNTGLPAGDYTEYFYVYGNDPDNPSDTVTINITVGSGSCVSVIADVQCFGNVCFTDSVNGGALSVHWDFGDGTTSDIENPCHVYALSGIYDVTVIGCGDFGCDTVTTTIIVSLLSAGITYTGALFEDLPVDFSSNSQNAVSWDWNFGDGTTSVQEDPQHIYTDEGTYTVTLTITDSSGCSITITDSLVILSTGIAGPGNSFSVLLYPNPANSLSNLEYFLPQASDVTVELWNGIAQRVSVIVTPQTQLSGKYIYPIRLDEGAVYYVRMKIGEREYWQELINVK